MKTESLQEQWIKHVITVNNDRGSDPKDIIENVSMSAADGIRGDLTGKEYTMPDALAMTKKYDKLAAAGYFRKDPHINSLSATDAVIASMTGKDAADYHKQKPSLIKNWNELRAKRNKILNDIKIEKKRGDVLKKAWGLDKKIDGGVKYVGSREHLLDKIPILKNNVNNKKSQKYYKKVASAPNKPEDANGHDPYPNVIPIGPIPHEKPWWETNYQFKFPKKEKYTVLDKIKLQADLEKAADAVSGIGQFRKRTRLASGSNGSTSKWEEDHPFTKRVQDIYGIQLTGQETFGELLEIIRKINERE